MTASRSSIPKAGTGNGFKFVDPEPAPLVDAAARAVAMFKRPAEWRRLVASAMAADFSWARSAAAYLELYKKLARSRFRPGAGTPRPSPAAPD